MALKISGSKQPSLAPQEPDGLRKVRVAAQAEWSRHYAEKGRPTALALRSLRSMAEALPEGETRAELEGHLAAAEASFWRN